MKKLLNGFLTCISAAKWWLIAQLLLTPVLLLLGVAWLRIPDAHIWQFILWVLLGLVILAAFLWLQAGTLRSLIGGEMKTRIVFAALWLLCAGVLAWIAYSTITHYDDQFDLAAGYLNSRLPAGRIRAAWLTREHITTLFNWLEWLLIWLGIPGLLIPIAAVASVDGVKLPSPSSLNFFAKKRWWLTVLLLACFVIFVLWSKLYWLLLLTAVGLLVLDWKSIRSVWCNWRWWPLIFLVALAWNHWFMHIAAWDPHGAPHVQTIKVVLHTAFAYLFTIFCWVAPLVWVAVLLARSSAKQEGSDDAFVPVLAGGPDDSKSAAAAVQP